jgi:hypothetical protein
LADSSVRNTLKAKCIGGSFSPASWKRDYWPSGYHRTEIELQFINEARVHRLTQHVAAALNQYARDPSLA